MAVASIDARELYSTRRISFNRFFERVWFNENGRGFEMWAGLRENLAPRAIICLQISGSATSYTTKGAVVSAPYFIAWARYGANTRADKAPIL